MFKRKTLMENGEYFYNVGILLQSGEIHVISNPTILDKENWILDQHFEKSKFVIEGNGDIFNTHGDPQDFKCNYFLTLREVAEAEENQDQNDDDHEPRLDDAMATLQEFGVSEIQSSGLSPKRKQSRMGEGELFQREENLKLIEKNVGKKSV